MNKKLLILHILFLLTAFGAYAQEIGGTVKDSAADTPIEGASILLRNPSGVPVAYGYSAEDGTFSVKVPDNRTADSLVFEVRMLGYSPFRLFPPFPENIEVRLEEDRTELAEVVVTAKQVEKKGDTVTYYIPTLVTTDDRNLGDVLVKLPGISVDRSGFVKVYGKSINKFYIEGSDLLEHRYNIATKNLDPRDIKEVKVYEMHQPVRALEGIVESDRAAIDIILKESAKAQWLGTLQAEVGGSTQKPWVPYSAGGMLMNISKTFQTINVLKTDAAGNTVTSVLNNADLATDLNNFDFRYRYTPSAYTGISHDTAPIDDIRTRFNNTWAASTNNKFTVGKKKQLVIGVSGLYEDEVLDSDNSVTRTYDLGDGTATSFTERNATHSRAYAGYGNINATVNTRQLYLRENFQIEFSGSDAANSLGGTSSRTENAGLEGMNILNYLRFVKRLDRTGFGLEIFTQYSELSEDLEIASSGEEETAIQNIDGKYFFNTVKYNFSHSPVKWLTLRSYTSLDYLHRRFASKLAGLTLPDRQPVLDNDVTLQYIKPYESLYAEFSVKQFKATAGAELWYQYINYHTDSRGNDHKLAVNPTVSIKYDFGPRFGIRAGAAYRLSPIDEQQIFTGLIMRNYKYLTQGRTDLEQLPGYSIDGEIDFRDPISGWYLKGSAYWSAGRSFELTRYFIGDDYIVNVQSNDVNDYSLLSASAEISKAFTSLAGKITGIFDYTRYTSSILQNSIVTDYDSDSYSAGLRYNGGLASWLSLQYSGDYVYSLYYTGGKRNGEDNHDMSHALTLSFFPFQSMELDLTGEYYFSKFGSDSPVHCFFLDLSAWYFVNSRLQFFIHARNLLDEREYAYSYIGPLEAVRYSYRIRPMNILVGAQIKF